jgi:hypothetical protein
MTQSWFWKVMVREEGSLKSALRTVMEVFGGGA